MRQLQLGRTGIMVSEWCLGTMTFPTHTPEAEAHRQIDMSLDAGLNFIDTAEMYPVNPVARATAGTTESCIGNWIAKTGKRDSYVIATKVAGKNSNIVRDGRGYDGAIVKEAVDASLRRLQTEVIDLYQLHWPLRSFFQFRQNWSFNPKDHDRQKTLDHMADVLGAMADLVKAGKVRAFGLSNESAWGTTKWIDVAEQIGAPRVASIQNEYSLLYRTHDTDQAEVAVNEDVTLLSFSPLACGLLTGKYQGGAKPVGSRLALGDGTLGGRHTPRALATTQIYLDLAARHGLDPVHMAMAWQRTRPFPVSTIFGATTVAQLEQILAGRDVHLSKELIAEIDKIHRANPMPY